MPKDYAKTRSKTKSKRPVRASSKQSNTEGRLWLLASVLTGLFILSLIYLKQEGVKLSREQAATPTTKVSNPHLAKLPPSPSLPQPRFDFYTMLPNQQTSESQSEEATTPATQAAAPVIASPTSTTLSAPSARAEVAALEKEQLDQESQKLTTQQEIQNKSLPKSSQSVSYIIQLGIFKDYASADELKAQVVLLGFEAKIKAINRNGSTAYRVWIGPYKMLTEAKKQQENLKANQIKNEVIKNGLE